MTQDEQDSIHEIVNQEGFDYTFLYVENFEDVNDTEFHRLRKAYIDASAALYEYLKMDGSEFAPVQSDTKATMILKPTLKSW